MTNNETDKPDLEERIEQLEEELRERWRDERALVARRFAGASRRERQELEDALDAAHRIAERRLRRWATENDVTAPAAQILDDVVEDSLARVTGEGGRDEEE